MRAPALRLAAVPQASPRARWTPPLSILIASSLATAPIVATAPTMPPFGLLMVLSWRLLRPDLWRAWMALPLGIADDLLSGQPFGLSAATWTVIFLFLEAIDYRLMLRESWLDWALGAVAMVFAMVAGAVAVGLEHGGPALLLPQMVIAILCLPVAARIALALDRWRLRR